ncbi:MAG: type IX secretion system protein PorQ [Cytophagales bacterium]|nr:type IX secretion system protein PorQ [Cytophagales bacterium]MDW8384947.1 type IX secretion system protein PorQ [Flammeovirgaceae bacterium]
MRHFLLLVCFLPFYHYGQIGGSAHFNFLELPSFAHLSGLGGSNVSSYSNDGSMFLANPSLLYDSTSFYLGLHHQFLFAQTHMSAFTYVHRFSRSGVWAIGVQHLNYGTFTQTDFLGNELGTFRAYDYAITVAKSHTIGNVSMGIATKLAQSRIEVYQMSASLWDVGGNFKHPHADWRIGVVLKNVGFRLSAYAGAPPFESPFDVMIGTSYKPFRMPVRFSVTLRQLHRFMKLDANTSFETPILSLDGTNHNSSQSVSAFNRFSRHLVLGGELLLSSHVHIRLGYNFLTRRELHIDLDRFVFSGFSCGLAIKLRKFDFGYSYYRYHVAAATHQVSLLLNMREWFGSERFMFIVE